MHIVLLTVMAVGLMPVFAFQQEGGPSPNKDVKAWEKPISKCWSYDLETVFQIPIVSDQKGFLYAALAEGAVAAIDTATGKQAWHSGLGGQIRALRSNGAGRIIVLSEQESEKKDKQSLFLQSLSDETGITGWRKELDLSASSPLSGIGAFLLTRNGSVFLVREDGNVTAFNVNDGVVLWQSFAGGKISAAPAMTEKNLILGTEDKKLLEMDLETGKPGRSFTVPAAPAGSLLATGESIVFSDQIGNIYAVNSANSAGGELIWKARAGAEVSDISRTDLGVLVSSNDNFVYLLSLTQGDRKWKRKFSGRLMGKPVLYENYGLFVMTAGTEAPVLDLNKGKIVNNVPLTGRDFFTNGAGGAGGSGFALATSRGISFYAPGGCVKK